MWSPNSHDLFTALLLCCSVAQSCLTLYNPIDCSMPGFLVLHCLPEFVQIHVHWVDDAIQPPHLLLHASPPALNFSQHQGQLWATESALHIRWPKYWSFSLSISPSNEYSGLISFRMDWFDKMSMFTLAISCLTTFILPWFLDLTFQVPMQYCSLQHRTLLLSPVNEEGEIESEKSRFKTKY